MTHWTKDDLTSYLARQKKQVVGEGKPDPGPESELQRKCIKFCDACGWVCIHDWSKKKNKAGVPDLTIYMANGRVELIELKSAAGKLRAEQQALHRQLMFLGHSVHVVKSYKRFVEIMKGEP